MARSQNFKIKVKKENTGNTENFVLKFKSRSQS